MDKQEVGRVGEDAAVAHLAALGWRVVERNWRWSLGEVDIIAVTPGGQPTLVFCEVKCRTGLGYGDPLEALTYAKRRKLRDLALTWLGHQPSRVERFRIDAIGVLLPPGQPAQVTHVQGIG